jgi:hypothetical protein
VSHLNPPVGLLGRIAEFCVGRDYQGATDAGLNALLVRRPGEWSEGTKRLANEDLVNVPVVNSLSEVLSRLRAQNKTEQ